MLMRCIPLALLAAFALAAVPHLATAQAPSDVAPPNVVILFADDLGYGDLSSYGSPTIRTPNLDRMAEEGIKMTSFYAAAPVCSPSRAALLTGRYAMRVGLPHVLGPDSENGLPEEELTLAEALKAQNYRTMAVGKWHLGSTPGHMPTEHGFDAYFGLLYSNDMIPPWVETDRPLALYQDLDALDERPVDQTTLTTRYTAAALEFIDEAAEAEEPFFLYLAYSMPHLPVFAPEERQGLSRAGRYGDVIETIDWSAGQVLNRLDSLGLAGNTLVVFTSDNGPWNNLPDRMLQEGNEPWHTGSTGPLRGAKATTYEGGVRVPGLIRWPGVIEGGRTSAEIATTMDLFPTILHAAGAEIPERLTLDGNDLRAFLTGEAETAPTEAFYYFLGEDLEAVREGRWKYRHTPRRDDGSRTDDAPPVAELYDLDVDPAEKYNIAERHPDVVERLSTRLQRFAEEIGADVPGAAEEDAASSIEEN